MFQSLSKSYIDNWLYFVDYMIIPGWQKELLASSMSDARMIFKREIQMCREEEQGVLCWDVFVIKWGKNTKQEESAYPIDQNWVV